MVQWLVLRCVDGIVLRIVRCPHEGVTARVVDRADRGQAVAEGERVDGINLSSDAILGLFDGPPLRRAQRVAALSSIRFLLIFGRPRQPGGHYKTGHRLRRIGRAIPEAVGCGHCEQIQGACAGCARRIVSEVLEDEPVRFLYVAAKHTDPARQLEAVIAARDTEVLARRPRAAA
jgi:hypothetical protein